MGKHKKKCFSYSAGERGRNRVRVFEESPQGPIFLEYYDRGGPNNSLLRRRKSLGRISRESAKKRADEVASQFETLSEPHAEHLTLGELFDKYLCEVTPRKAESTQEHEYRCARLLGAYYGRARRVESLDPSDFDRFVLDRTSGSTRLPGLDLDAPVGKRTAARDLEWLRAVLNWGARLRDQSGSRRMRRNPADELEIPKEKNPNRPIVSEVRYEAMLAVADQVDWRFRLALVLAHETGHRIGAIRQLRWSDIDLGRKTVVWRAPTDKVGFEHATHITEAVVEVLERARTDHPGIGSAWVMPAPRDGSKPCSRDLVRAWWYRAERKAGLERIRGLGWHGLRRKFATDLKDVPLVDLGALGGWKRPETILRLYQQPDLETQQAALAKRRKVAASQH